MSERERWRGLFSVCLDAEPPAKQMMINEATGRPAFRTRSTDGEPHMSLFSLITSHLPLALPQPLSSAISSRPRLARHLPLVWGAELVLSWFHWLVVSSWFTHANTSSCVNFRTDVLPWGLGSSSVRFVGKTIREASSFLTQPWECSTTPTLYMWLSFHFRIII